jgi:hypothetical protein
MSETKSAATHLFVSKKPNPRSVGANRTNTNSNHRHVLYGLPTPSRAEPSAAFAACAPDATAAVAADSAGTVVVPSAAMALDSWEESIQG